MLDDTLEEMRRAGVHVGYRIRAARRRAGLTLAVLGGMTGLTTAALSRAELACQPILSREHVDALERALSIDLTGAHIRG